MMVFERLNEELRKSYYTFLVSLVIEFILILVAFSYVKRARTGHLFLVYLGLDFSIGLVDLFLISYPGITKNFITNFYRYSNNFIALVELMVYYYFFSKIFKNSKIRTVLIGVGGFYLIIIIIYFSTKFNFITIRDDYISDLVSAMEFVLLLPPCLLYYSSLLHENLQMNLFERPSFWIVTGIFLFSFVSIPYYLLKRYISQAQPELSYVFNAALYTVPIILNFVFLTKAFLCKKHLTI